MTTLEQLDAAREAAALSNRHHELLAFSGVHTEDDVYALHDLVVIFIQASEAITQDVVDTIVLARAAHDPTWQGPQECEPEATTWHELARDAVFCFLFQIEKLIHDRDGSSTFSWFGGSHTDADEMKERLLTCDDETLKQVSEAAKTTFARAGSRLESNIAREWAVARTYVQRIESNNAARAVDVERVGQVQGDVDEPVKPDVIPDGPGRKGEFHYKGKTASGIERKPWLLLKLAWDNHPNPVDLAEVGEQVWDSDVIPERRIRTAASKVTRAMLEEEMPITVHVRDEQVLLDIGD